ncbi:EAL domain-containing protein [Paludibacterium yongneupense]|uniref:EAL domain-containing protein n=1 Tax=Paludibacterium yongneupense TaxID=400061 RepID=UPI0004195501|nr:EAL domain-containing protein [Paludibacterium yongneupense]
MSKGNAELLAPLCRFVGVGPEHFAVLSRYAPRLLIRRSVLGKQLYWHLLHHPDSSDVLAARSGSRTDRLIDSQLTYFERMLTRAPDSRDVKRAMAQGRRCHRLGISLVWLGGAYEHFLSHMLEAVEALGAISHVSKALEEALRKRVSLDLLLQLQGYQDAVAASGPARATARLYATLSGVSLALIHATDRSLLFQSICRICVEEGGFGHAWIGWIDQDSKQVRKVAMAGQTSCAFLEKLDVSVDVALASGRGPTGRAIRSLAPQVINNVSQSESLAPWHELLLNEHIQSVLSTPLTIQGRAVGVLVLYAYERNFFDDAKVGLVRTMGSEISHALERQEALERSQKAETELAFLIQHDPLTGLPNRMLMQERIGLQMMRSGEGARIGVVTLAIDGFHEINARLGHESGDVILREVALRMSHLALPLGSMGRVGAARFVACTDNVGEIERLVIDLLAAMNEPVLCKSERVSFKASIGIALEGANVVDASTLMRRSDLALIRARDAGGGQHCYYDETMDQEIHRLYQLRAAFADALANDELELFYQPKINLKSHRISGVEALVRWRRDGKLMAPGQFFPAIEQTDLMRELDWWVLGEALRHCHEWMTLGHSIPVSVNLSAVTLQHGTFLPRLQSLIMRYPLPDGHLELEVLESVSLKQAEDIVYKLECCRDIGISIALDDFGTGASSLVHLQQLPFDTIKIDQRFVRMLLEAPGNEAIIRSMISFAHYSGRTLVVEGVESQPIWDRLLEIGCSSGQGYAISPPVSSKHLLDWVDEQVPCLPL